LNWIEFWFLGWFIAICSGVLPYRYPITPSLFSPSQNPRNRAVRLPISRQSAAIRARVRANWSLMSAPKPNFSSIAFPLIYLPSLTLFPLA
jgi:hypothetical protein